MTRVETGASSGLQRSDSGPSIIISEIYGASTGPDLSQYYPNNTGETMTCGAWSGLRSALWMSWSYSASETLNMPQVNNYVKWQCTWKLTFSMKFITDTEVLLFCARFERGLQVKTSICIPKWDQNATKPLKMSVSARVELVKKKLRWKIPTRMHFKVPIFFFAKKKYESGTSLILLFKGLKREVSELQRACKILFFLTRFENCSIFKSNRS